MADNKEHLSDEEILKKVESLPNDPLVDYCHKEWVNIIEQNEFVRHIISGLTLEKVLDAQRTGEELEVTYISGYTPSMIGNRVLHHYDENFDANQPERPFEFGKEKGDRAVYVKFTENTQTVKIKITSVEVTQESENSKDKMSDRKWSAVGQQIYYYEHNYNAGDGFGINTYTVTFDPKIGLYVS